MIFKYPELLWALLLLIIPILIHLFQLRRFKKTAFTNVNLLKKINLQTRKSSSLKKWLLLATRMLVYAAIIIAFAQPFLPKSDSSLKPKELVIYLDNSFSMQAPSTQGSLLVKAIQDLVQNIEEKKEFSLFTNTKTYKKTTITAIQNELLKNSYHNKQLSYDEILLKGKSLFSSSLETQKDLVIISDFQERFKYNKNRDSTINTKLVKLSPKTVTNTSLDSIYISKENSENIELTAELATSSELSTVPITVYNNATLLTKASALFKDNKAKVSFTIPANSEINGSIAISDNGLQYDNTLYFNANKKEKINVLAIGENDYRFLSRIFTEDEFEYSSVKLKEVNYSIIPKQHTIILHEIDEIPNSLIATLKSFSTNGGNIIIIPSNAIHHKNYNALSAALGFSSFTGLENTKLDITTINFNHPIFTDVFEKQVSNFQYPKVNSYHTNSAKSNSILNYQNGNSFLFNANNTYVFTAALNAENSNFKNSPLIVPLFYNIAKHSLQTGDLYKISNTPTVVDINTSLKTDEIIKIKRDSIQFIPLQQSFNNKVRLNFASDFSEEGIFEIRNATEVLEKISFNHPRVESKLIYSNLDSETTYTSVSNLLEKIKSDTKIDALWKWFAIFALLFLTIEMLILKLFK